jgi:signal transduction histidine kinase
LVYVLKEGVKKLAILESYIKYFGIAICTFYVYFKILKQECTKKDISFYLLVTSSFPVLTCEILFNLKTFIIPTQILISLIYFALHTKAKLSLSITTTMISFGISYIFYYVAVFVIGAIFSFNGVKYTYVNNIYAKLCVAGIQYLLSYLLFKIRRLKSGMPFLINKADGRIGLLISFALIACFICSSNAGSPTSYLFTIPILFVVLGSVGIFVWWKNRLTKNYLKKLKNNEFQELQNALQKQKEEIRRLKQHNDALAKIIHKDNKLIPTMELAVREYLGQRNSPDALGMQQKGHALLKELQAISSERSGVIKDYQHCHVKVPTTGVFPIDSLLQYMCCKAQAAGIQLKLTLLASMKYLTENIIPSSDLRTILADLIENAVIAIKSSNSSNKKILVSLGIINQFYEMDIYDSGIPFESETIRHLGQKNNTTHADAGGSGIGLVTVLEILERYNASFCIEQIQNTHNIFTKKISIKFDNFNERIFKTDNNELVHILPAAHYSNVNFENSKQ